MKAEESIKKILADREDRRKKASLKFKHVKDRDLKEIINKTSDLRYLNQDERLIIKSHYSAAQEELNLRQYKRWKRRERDSKSNSDLPITERLFEIEERYGHELMYSFRHEFAYEWRDYARYRKWLKLGKPTQYWGEYRFDSEKHLSNSDRSIHPHHLRNTGCLPLIVATIGIIAYVIA